MSTGQQRLTGGAPLARSILGLRRHPARMLFRLRHPKTTVRWRLTLLYGALFLASGAVLLGITYTLVEHASVTSTASFIKQAAAPPANPKQVGGGFGEGLAATPATPAGGIQANSATPSAKSPTSPKAARQGTLLKATPSRNFVTVPPAVQRLLGSQAGRRVIRTVGSDQRIADLHQLMLWSGIALAIMAIISAALGWVVAGRVLRPLRTITAATQQISAANLNQRLAIDGPRDELRGLADTIDALLARLEGAFDAQRRFVANASHELRTPLTSARALLEMVLSDPRATTATYRSVCQEVLEESEQQEQLIDALLALAHGQRGLEAREPLDLATITREVLRTHEPRALEQGLSVQVALAHAPVYGDRRLLERMIANLLENATVHNIPDGRIELHLSSDAGRATVQIANTGAPIPAGEIERLLQPFQRLARERTTHHNGLGLGLSIIAAIATAHDAALELHPGPDGGLQITIRFPATAGNHQPSAHRTPATVGGTAAP